MPDIASALESASPEVLRELGGLLTASARADLNAFARHVTDHIPATHHRFMNARLMAVARGEIKRLMLLCPPGSAKSTYASLLFPAWYLGNNPTHNVIAASHTTSFAESWGRKVRNLFGSPDWPFHVKLASDSQAAGYWSTSQGGEYYAVGVGAAVTGRRGDCIICDDPLKGREDAESEVVREKLWDWWRADLHTRLKPTGAIVLIQTRWHADDLAGRILGTDYDGRSGRIDGQDGERWHVVSLPALAEANDPLGRTPGEALWPNWYSKEYLLAERHLQGEYNWSSLYQQRPSPAKGGFFQRDWFQFYDIAPNVSSLRIYGASDYAVSAGRGDHTVHMIVGVDRDDNLYVLDLWRGQVDAAAAVDQWADMVSKWRPTRWYEDKASFEKTLAPFLDARQRELGIYCHREALACSQNKEQRAGAIAGRASQRKVFLPSRKPWVHDLLSELLVFPNGKWDDQCLAPETLITMADGSRKVLEAVSVGDMVATPDGPSRVLASAVTNASAEVFRVSFSDGRSLTATGGHPVFVEERGFVPVDALCIMDRVRTDREFTCGAVHQRPRLSSIWGTGIADTLMGKISRIRDISSRPIRVVVSFIVTYGKIITGQFRPIMKFITLTKIPPIIDRKISNAFQKRSTETSIHSLDRHWSDSSPISQKSGHLQNHGTIAMLVDSIIAKCQKQHGIIVNQLKRFALVVGNTLPPFEPLQRSVVARATNECNYGGHTNRIRLGEEDTIRTKSRLNAFSVINRFSQSGPNLLFTAQNDVVSITGVEKLSKLMTVRNLTVDNAHAFYANGILTHNCDCLSLFGRGLAGMRTREHVGNIRVIPSGPRRLVHA